MRSIRGEEGEERVSGLCSQIETKNVACRAANSNEVTVFFPSQALQWSLLQCDAFHHTSFRERVENQQSFVQPY
jgi:hypothetical protein